MKEIGTGMAPTEEIKTLAMIGCGSMGGGMALLFAQNGLHVSLEDPSEDTMDKIIEQATKEGFGQRISKHKDYKSLCESLDRSRVFVLSLPHGKVGDSVLEGLEPYLDKDDIIIDCGNEHWENTERRQGKAFVRGVRYVGCGVSGGYQAARRGPSMCPGSDDETLDLILPLLRKVAAKDSEGRPCVGKVGTGGSGHYVKMIHNGIEHGMMSAISEAWSIMVHGLGMTYDDVARAFEQWTSKGELRGTFLIDIGIRICQTKDPQTNERVLSTVEDKVVQDFTGEEGTGIWSNTESVEQHVPAPTLAVAHFLRLASGEREHRTRAKRVFGEDFSPQQLTVDNRNAFLEDLRLATYSACLVSFVQGINVIDAANKSHKWNIDYSQVLQIWRAGCIIQADAISEILAPIFEGYKQRETMNLLFESSVMNELKKSFESLKKVVAMGVNGCHFIPALSASLEYIKYMTSTDLPAQFYEAELDYFGKHMYDKKGEDPKGLPMTGKYHYEWKPA